MLSPMASALLGSLATAARCRRCRARLGPAKVVWHSNQVAELRQQNVNLPVVFLTGKVIAGDENDRCLLAPAGSPGCRRMHGVRPRLPSTACAKSRDRQVIARRLRRIVKLVKPKADVAQVEERLACHKLVLKSKAGRAFWNQVDVGLHARGIQRSSIILASNGGRYVTYRAALRLHLHYEGFIAGSGKDGFHANVRSAIKRVRAKFRACDDAFDEIENYTGFGYGWRKPLGIAAVIQRLACWRLISRALAPAEFVCGELNRSLRVVSGVQVGTWSDSPLDWRSLCTIRSSLRAEPWDLSPVSYFDFDDMAFAAADRVDGMHADRALIDKPRHHYLSHWTLPFRSRRKHTCQRHLGCALLLFALCRFLAQLSC